MRRQAGLRRTAAPAPQYSPHRQTEVHRDVVGLVEAAVPEPHPMQRNGHDGVRAVERVRAFRAHPSREHGGDHSPLAVFQRVNHLPQRAVIDPGAADDIDCVAAQLRRLLARPVFPTGCTDRAGERIIERPVARRARRRQQRTDQGVRGSSQHGRS
jgi:hypothetical protein